MTRDAEVTRRPRTSHARVRAMSAGMPRLEASGACPSTCTTHSHAMPSWRAHRLPRLGQVTRPVDRVRIETSGVARPASGTAVRLPAGGGGAARPGGARAAPRSRGRRSVIAAATDGCTAAIAVEHLERDGAVARVALAARSAARSGASPRARSGRARSGSGSEATRVRRLLGQALARSRSYSARLTLEPLAVARRRSRPPRPPRARRRRGRSRGAATGRSAAGGAGGRGSAP